MDVALANESGQAISNPIDRRRQTRVREGLMKLYVERMEPALQGFADVVSRKLESKYFAVSVLFALILIFCFQQFEYLAISDLFFKHGESQTYHLALASYVNGRFVPGLLFYALSSVGVEWHSIWILLQLVAYLSFAIFAYVFVDKLETKSTPIEKTLCSAIIVLFPYSITYFIHKNHYLNIICVMTFVTLAIISYRHRNIIVKYVATTVFLVLTLVSYQTAIYYFVVFVCAYHLFHEETLRATVRAILPGAVACVIAFGLVLLTYHAVLDSVMAEMADTGDPVLYKYFSEVRSAFNRPEDLIHAARIYIAIVGRTLFLPEPIMPLALKIIGAAVLLLAYQQWRIRTSGGTESSLSESAFGKRGLVAFALILLVAGLMQFSFANERTMRYVLTNAAAVWGALFVLIFLVSSPTSLKAALAPEKHTAAFGTRYRKQGVLVLALLLFAASPIHVFIVKNWHAPRVLMHVATVWASLLLLALGSASPKWRRSLVGATGVFAFGMGLTTAFAMSSIVWLYNQDLRLSRQIVADLRAQEGFDPGKPVAFVGRIPRTSSYFHDVFSYRFNLSKFNSDWTQYAIVEEATGLRLPRGDMAFQERAQSVCSRIRAPEAYYRTVIVPEGAVICLSSSIDPTFMTLRSMK